MADVNSQNQTVKEQFILAFNYPQAQVEWFAPGEMTMEANMTPEKGATRVSIAFTNMPSSIRPEDNETGTCISLEKLARYIA
jgi:hypothetical protein